MKRLKPPAFVRIKKNVAYEVVQFKSERLDGETIKDANGHRQIRLNEDLSAKERELTLIHEALHAISFEYKVNLTESQVLKLEKGLLNFLRLNKDWLVF